MLAFGADDDSWHPQQPSPGEFALYDEFDPRRIVRLNDDGTKVIAGSGGREWLLNFVSNEGVSFPGGVSPDGVPYGPANNDGNDVMFGDLGNDWMVGGTGQRHDVGRLGH